MDPNTIMWWLLLDEAANQPVQQGTWTLAPYAGLGMLIGLGLFALVVWWVEHRKQRAHERHLERIRKYWRDLR
jgi:hypothetical protein